jgi:DNA helicase HerA-like ATPase
VIEVITGRMGEGKSGLAYYLARREHRGIFVFDPTEAFGIGTIVNSPSTLVEAAEKKSNVPIVYRPDGKIEEEIDRFCIAVQNFRDVSVIVDEAALVSSPHSIPDELARLVRRSRRLEIALYITAHRPQDLHGLFFSLGHNYKFFNTTFTRDLVRIAEYSSEDLAERVKGLPKHFYASWSVEQNNFFVNSDPKSWRTDISGSEESSRSEKITEEASRG